MDGDHPIDERWFKLYKWNTIWTALGAIAGWIALAVVVVAVIV